MRTLCHALIIAALALALVGGAQAITVNVSVYKHNFTSNETIPSIVTNMTLGAYYSQKTTFYQYMKPGEISSIGNNNVTWPFAHADEVFNMTNVNTTNNSVYIGHWWPPERGGGYEQLWFNGTSYDIWAPNGTILHDTWNRTYHYEYDQIGTYISRWNATPSPGAAVVESTFWINGSKLYGPTNFSENTSVWSRNPSYVTVDFYENNTHAAEDWFTIDMDMPVEPTLTPDDGDAGAVGTISGGSDAETTATTTATTVAAGTGTPVITGTATPAGTPAGTPTATPIPTTPVGTDTGAFPWLSLLGLLLILGLVLGGFVVYSRRKNNGQQ